MSLKAVFLDVGFTLLHEVPSRGEIYAAAARARGVDVGEQRMRGLMRAADAGLPTRLEGAYRYTDPWLEAFIARIFRDDLGLPESALPDITAELFARFSDPATFRFFPGALELLDTLAARGLRVGIVSNWSARLPGLLEGLGVAQRVDFLVVSALEESEKPDARIFERALELAGCAPAEALHAGDKPEKDLAGARAAGIDAVLVDHLRKLADLDQPRVESLPALQRYVEGRLA